VGLGYIQNTENHDAGRSSAAHSWPTDHPQVIHIFIHLQCVQAVNNWLLLHCNAPVVRVCGLSQTAFLPTMKLQLSQLPKIVGSGRVRFRRALFSFMRLCGVTI
jgi:hypothetical protein